MPFSASLIMGKGGPTAYTKTMPSTGTTLTTVATQEVPAGSWLVAVEINGRAGYSSPSVVVNGIMILGDTSTNAPSGTATVVTGPVTIQVQVRQVNSGTVYISKLP